MAGSTASIALCVIGLLAICALSLAVLRYYLPLRSNPAYLTVPVYLALVITASIVLLVPVDLVSSGGTDTEGSRGIWLPSGALLAAWKISYWLSFFMMWALLPLLGEYEDSGYREPKERVMYSLRSNGQFYGIMLASCIGVGIYFGIQSDFRMDTVRALVMALAYAWGLVLALYLMGHGLVALPRRLFREASVSGRLRRLQTQAPRLYDRLRDAADKFAACETQVLQLQNRKTGSAQNYRDWIDDLVEMCEEPEGRIGVSAPLGADSASKIPNVITEGYLADLTRQLKRARHQKMRFVDEWDRLVSAAADAQAILDSSSSKKLEFGRQSPLASQLQRWKLLTPYTRYLIHARFGGFLRLSLATVLSLASLAIVWSEVMKSVDPKLSLVGLTVVHHPRSDRSQIGLGGQAIAGLWIFYMCVAALVSVTEVKIWGNRALVRRGTYEESACWYSALISRLTVPLAYNFVTFTPPSIHLNTTFYQFLGKSIDFTPLGKGFSTFFPIFILLPVCATLFDIYGKAKRLLGLGDFMDNDDEEADASGRSGAWREGRDLIARDMSDGVTRHGLGLASRGVATSSRSAGLETDPMSPPVQSLQSARGAGRARPSNARAEIRNTQPADEESGSFFEDFAHRVRNTIDTTDRPAWMDGIKRPRWMSGDDAGAGEGGSGETGLARWFGGRSGEGRIRL